MSFLVFLKKKKKKEKGKEKKTWSFLFFPLSLPPPVSTNFFTLHNFLSLCGWKRGRKVGRVWLFWLFDWEKKREWIYVEFGCFFLWPHQKSIFLIWEKNIGDTFSKVILKAFSWFLQAFYMASSSLIEKRKGNEFSWNSGVFFFDPTKNQSP